jgi:fluoride exporter
MNNRTLFLKESLWVAAGGMLGASLRHGTNHLVPLLAGERYLLTATFAENILGCFLIGVLFTFLKKRSDKNRNLNLFLLTGMIGSYTTYSGFMTEALLIFRDSGLLLPAYIFGQILAGITAVWAGIVMALKIIIYASS